MAIVLQETLRGVFYAPFYAALALDAYGEEGVEVRLVSAPHPSESARGLADGTVDVTWGGPMRVMLTHEQDPELRSRLLLRGGDARSLLPGRPDAEARFQARRSDGQARGDRQRGADALAVPAGGHAAGGARSRQARSRHRSDRWRATRPRCGAARSMSCSCSSPSSRSCSRRERDTSGTPRPSAAPPPTRRSMRAARCWPSAATNASAWCAPSIAR